ncbi:unnamed protein product, partial [Staurois parvus]
ESSPSVLHRCTSSCPSVLHRLLAPPLQSCRGVPAPPLQSCTGLYRLLPFSLCTGVTNSSPSVLHRCTGSSPSVLHRCNRLLPFRLAHLTVPFFHWNFVSDNGGSVLLCGCYLCKLILSPAAN